MDTIKNRVKMHRLNTLSPQQIKALTDIKDFLNLSENQIIEHIYAGDAKLCSYDITYLLKKGILFEIRNSRIYYISKEGSRLVSGFTGDISIYNKLIRSRIAELSHDVFLYSAFKDFENQLKSEDKSVTRYKTIRQLKSEDMKIYGRMRTAYPNLYIEYVNENTKETGYINIVVCVNSKKAEILKKSELSNLVWYTCKDSQKDKIIQFVENAKVKVVKI